MVQPNSMMVLCQISFKSVQPAIGTSIRIIRDAIVNSSFSVLKSVNNFGNFKLEIWRIGIGIRLISDRRSWSLLRAKVVKLVMD